MTREVDLHSIPADARSAVQKVIRPKFGHAENAVHASAWKLLGKRWSGREDLNLSPRP
jgi:hypothetical protein